MDIEIFKTFNTESIKYNDFIDNYKIYVNAFLAEFQDNTETLFLDNQIDEFTYHKDELLGFIKGIDFVSEDREEYLQFLRNRILPFSFQGDKDDTDLFDIVLSEDYNEYSFCMYYLNNKKASVYKILEFLYNRKNELTQKVILPNISTDSKTASNDKIKDLTKMPWFIVGLNIANGEIESLHKKGFTQEKIALEIGLHIDYRNHISKSIGKTESKNKKSSLNVFDFDWKIKFIHDYCINKGIPMTPEFEKIAEKYL